MANRNLVTKEEATNTLINRPPNNGQNKVSQYLKEPNVKEFNKKLYSKAFMDMQGQSPFALKDKEECIRECGEFFDLCYTHDIVPSVASLSVYLRVDSNTIYTNINNPNSPVRDTLKQAVNLCHAIQQDGSIAGAINPVLYIFLSKNYHGMKDQNTLSLTTSLHDTTVNNIDTMKVIQEQIALEYNGEIETTNKE